MQSLAQKFLSVKTGVGGNREKRRYEDTFGMPPEEAGYITMPNCWHRRLLGELEFALKLTEALDGRFDACLHTAMDALLAAQAAQGALTRADVERAEATLSPMRAPAKEYRLILAGHAHIDMNWMWSYQETVAATLETFRTVLAIMDEYPDFCFSQSQAAVYGIVEEYDPVLMERIKTRIAEGRWEVTASAWVETDKNMPSTESLVRHILYTKKYLQEKWGVAPDDLQVDFSPDTFGHSAHVSELDRHGGVKYYYHCRGLDGDNVLYLWRAPSGAEMLVYREPYWYNGAVTPAVGAGLVDISRRCAGLKTGLVVYGVGDHGGGPTRRDIERAREMQDWPIFPVLEFGTFRAFFRAAESVRSRLPIVNHELNFIFPGCYTTQSRIKRGHRMSEAALLDAEAINALSTALTGAPYRNSAYEKAWRKVLFTQFHDILTGSCVQDSREHAMGLFGEAQAAANSARMIAMRAITACIDTSSLAFEGDLSASQSEGAGAGYGASGAAFSAAERGTGIRRIFHIFNPSVHRRSAIVEIAVWDWTGDMRRLRVRDSRGGEAAFQLLDSDLRAYWDHRYFRLLLHADLPAMGYGTYVLDEAEIASYPVYLQPPGRTTPAFGPYILENEFLRAELDASTVELTSLLDKKTGRELIRKGESAGLRLMDTEACSSSAWLIGRCLRAERLDRNVKVNMQAGDGSLRQGVEAEIPFRSSTARLKVWLDRGCQALQYELKMDWHEIARAGEPVPVLIYAAPLAFVPEYYLYDVPAGCQSRPALNQDVPGLQYGAAVSSARALAIVCDSKYGYRGDGRQLILTLVNASNNPDPYPERGVHNVRFAVAAADADPKTLEELAVDLNRLPAVLSERPHMGDLPMEASLLELGRDTSAVISGIKTSEDGRDIIVRLYNPTGEATTARLVLCRAPVSAVCVDALENAVSGDARVDGNTVSLMLDAYRLQAVRIQI
jgi:alpha-mannosidase